MCADRVSALLNLFYYYYYYYQKAKTELNLSHKEVVFVQDAQIVRVNVPT